MRIYYGEQGRTCSTILPALLNAGRPEAVNPLPARQSTLANSSKQSIFEHAHSEAQEILRRAESLVAAEFSEPLAFVKSNILTNTSFVNGGPPDVLYLDIDILCGIEKAYETLYASFWYDLLGKVNSYLSRIKSCSYSFRPTSTIAGGL